MARGLLLDPARRRGRARGRNLGPGAGQVPGARGVPGTTVAALDRGGRHPAAPHRTAPLLRGYLRLGAWVCAAPAHDPDFGVADLFVLLSMRRVNPRYLRHFLSLVPA